MGTWSLCPPSCVSASDSSSDDLELYDYLELFELLPFRRISVPFKVSHEENDPTHKQSGEQQKLEELEFNHIHTNDHINLIRKNASGEDNYEDAVFDNNECNTISEGEYILNMFVSYQFMEFPDI